MGNLKIVQIQYKTTTASPDYRLNKMFLNAGLNSTIVNLHSDIVSDEDIVTMGRKSRWIASLDTKIQSRKKRKRNSDLGEFSYPVFGSDLSEISQIKQADIIYIHWVLNGFMNMKSIEQLAKLNKPIIVCMHDTWTFTGGCHHFLECEKYKTACNTCPQFADAKKRDLSSKLFSEKAKIFSKYNNFYFVAPSKWLYDSAKKSALINNKPIFHIPNILEKNTFKAYDKIEAKKILDIDPEEKVIAFGAISIESPYKGWRYLQNALEILHKKTESKNTTVLIFGSGRNKKIMQAIPFKTKFAGFLTSDYATSLMYNAADVFVAPSLADNLPYTVLEATSCGTPVAAFEVGGIPELIAHKKNGYLAKHKNAEDLAEGIRFCLESNIKGYRLPQFETDIVFNQYLDLMNKLLTQNV